MTSRLSDGARDVPASVQLFLTSATLLFTELLLIRWIPANVVYVASGITYPPVSAANRVFGNSFRDGARPDTSLASNLIGTTLGGGLEYAALITRYQRLLLLVCAPYLLALPLRRGSGFLRTPGPPSAGDRPE